MALTEKLAITGISLLVAGIAFGWFLFPTFLQVTIHKQVDLKDGSPSRELWTKHPFFVEFKIYLFNVTNPNEVKSGAKPILHQVGPYFFEEWQEKLDLVDRDDDDTVEFNMKNKWIFRPDLSEGLTGQEELTLPHMYMLGLVLAAEKENPHTIPVMNEAIDSVFKNPENIFINVKAMDLMFDGIPIDCTVTDTAGKALCGMVEKNDQDLVQDGENTYKFSLFGAKNDTTSKNRLRVSRGIKRMQYLGVVVEYAGLMNISKWNDQECDAFRGTDGTMFHPYFKKDEDAVIFNPDLCRSLSSTFAEKTTVSGLLTDRYSLVFDESDGESYKKCYCPAPGRCLKKGVIDLFKCVGTPLIVSHPHFYLGDKNYLNMVEGLKPSEEEHKYFMDLEPLTGIPLVSKKRIQYNIMIHKIEKIDIMKNLPEVLLPIYWFGENMIMPDKSISRAKSKHTSKKIMNILRWIMVLGGLILLGIAGFLHFHVLQKMKGFDLRKLPNKMNTDDRMNVNIHTLPTSEIPSNTQTTTSESYFSYKR
ncbi:hypothetical protein QAD02_016075 [Eretmocerus hayati]|uniref:Uncharacterized protein n=1 Tax=Eretmocerus hayati TaxID=131215 RepID=A0ACC2PA20_9HYME|nr:hypothetical protein QAD02_016075 [Eretmocerus hayati]